MAHRIEPLPGSMRAHTKKRHRSDDESQKQVHDEGMIQDNLLLSDDDKRIRENNRTCIWLEDVYSEP